MQGPNWENLPSYIDLAIDRVLDAGSSKAPSVSKSPSNGDILTLVAHVVAVSFVANGILMKTDCLEPQDYS
jgi:hypothetical protein